MITATAAGLLHLFRVILPFACRDETLPPICTVRLHTATVDDSTVLVATATDRFVLGQIHMPVSGTLPGAHLIPADHVQKMLAILGAVEPDRSIDLSIMDDSIQIMGGGATLTGRLYDGQFPDAIGNLLAANSEPPTEPAGTVPVDARRLAPFIATADQLDDVSIMRVEHAAADRPVRIRIGDRFRGLAMPHKNQDTGRQLPWFLTPSEQTAAGT